MYFATSALFLARKIRIKTHRGLIAIFGQEFEKIQIVTTVWKFKLRKIYYLCLICPQLGPHIIPVVYRKPFRKVF
jgi:hypothetical protein